MMNNIEIIRSKRKTISLEVKSDLRVIVRAPLRMKDKDINKFIDSKSMWIENKLNIVRNRQQLALPKLTDDEIKTLAKEALNELPKRVEYYASMMSVTPNRITIRNQKTRWGSCSSKCNLNFNCLLMLCPKEVRDYIIVHELSHLKELNHSAQFWKIVEQFMPDYKIQRKWLKENGNSIIGRLK